MQNSDRPSALSSVVSALRVLHPKRSTNASKTATVARARTFQLRECIRSMNAGRCAMGNGFSLL
jgi:hypothetical protein